MRMERCDWSIKRFGHGFKEVDPGVPGGRRGGLGAQSGAMSVHDEGESESNVLG